MKPEQVLVHRGGLLKAFVTGGAVSSAATRRPSPLRGDDVVAYDTVDRAVGSFCARRSRPRFALVKGDVLDGTR